MNKVDINIFFEIVKTGSIQKAASTLFLSSSAVSQRLNALETELGIILFERGKGVKESILTEKGHEFFKIALDLKYSYENAYTLKEQSVQPFISIACVDSLISDVLTPFFNDIVFNDPFFKMNLQCYRSDKLYPLIQNREVNTAFVLFNHENKNINITPLFSDDMVLIAPSNSSIKGKYIHTNSLDPNKEIALGKSDQLYMGWGPLYKNWHDNWFDSSIQPLIDASSLHWSSVFYSGHDFWAIIPRLNAISKQNQYNLKIFELVNPPPMRTAYQLLPEKQTNILKSHVNNFNFHLYKYISNLSKEGNIIDLVNK